MTFLEMTRDALVEPVWLPEGYSVTRFFSCALPLYRSLYEKIGENYGWWMRRPMPDRLLKDILSDPSVFFMVLKNPEGKEIGFYELDMRKHADAHLAYFGLVPEAIGQGLGKALLNHAIRETFEDANWRLRVNTSTLDHPHALRNYRRAGFVQTAVIPEVWNVSDEYITEELRQKIIST
ncbi:GNAT family N-acetyltransferase [Swingsia samuiensis]|uniref:GNAT family N-acetyltransferase n=1 Tax=Swingsia samuiensis TaxID=1293412 RepID=UPI001FE36A53|nr:GNAT family N-acetyltransferase [Swingsia samuiensis]